jgi:hypothetical protein
MQVGKEVTAMYIFGEMRHKIVASSDKSKTLFTEMIKTSKKKKPKKDGRDNNDSKEQVKTINNFEWNYDEERMVYYLKGSKNTLLRPF